VEFEHVPPTDSAGPKSHGHWDRLTYHLLVVVLCVDGITHQTHLADLVHVSGKGGRLNFNTCTKLHWCKYCIYEWLAWLEFGGLQEKGDGD